MGPIFTPLAGISLANFLRDRCGATAAEYALLLALISGGLALSAAVLGESISDTMNRTSTLLDTSGQQSDGGCSNNGRGTGFGGGNGGGNGQGAGNGRGNSC
jgi:pilus assembly protein Flp/PilA